LRVADVADHDCDIADGDRGGDRDVKGALTESPSAFSESAAANRIPDPASLGESVDPELEGKGDGNRGVVVDSGVGVEEERVIGVDVLGGLRRQ
jgi:hypothetical protein